MRRQWHPTPVPLPGKSHGRRSLVGYTVHGVAKSQTWLSDFTFTFHFHALEKEMATHSSILAWRILWRGAWWAAVHGVAQSRTWLKWLSMHACIGEGNGNPLQYSCLENPRDRGAWWVTVYGVAQSQIRLKWLSSSSKFRNKIKELFFTRRNVEETKIREKLELETQFGIC